MHARGWAAGRAPIQSTTVSVLTARLMAPSHTDIISANGRRTISLACGSGDMKIESFCHKIVF